MSDKPQVPSYHAGHLACEARVVLESDYLAALAAVEGEREKACEDAYHLRESVRAGVATERRIDERAQRAEVRLQAAERQLDYIKSPEAVEVMARAEYEHYCAAERKLGGAAMSPLLSFEGYEDYWHERAAAAHAALLEHIRPPHE
jgi:hypothetical protein